MNWFWEFWFSDGVEHFFEMILPNRVEHFLIDFIPTTLSAWFLFFILPAVLSFVGQICLCAKNRSRIAKGIPVYIAAFIWLYVLIYRFAMDTAVMRFVVRHTGLGSFLALFLVGTGGCILVGAAAGWLVYGIGWMVRRAAYKQRM